ncbi:GGDEF domain-containing protein [Photobacterium makurazakiensis]|uniref:GGDEF domain-containing protein n=1 Tax=Photobacterium makurazakiensis TaxID=2910234 RepID=UPI003D0EBA76
MNAFYLYSMWVLDFPTVYSGYLYGYTLLPIIHVAMLTVLPVTLKESLSLLTITAMSQLTADYQSTPFISPENIANYWLQTTLAFIVIWSQLSKLYMLMRLYRQATLDPLTGIYNRRMLLQLAQKNLTLCKSKKQPFSVLLIDIDKFKRINDTWGHNTGDHVLRDFTDLIQRQVKSTDLFGRYGGEEFVLFLPNTPSHIAQYIAEQMLTNIRQLKFPTIEENNRFSVTASIGITSYCEGDNISTMLERADQALYTCKDAGRDCSRLFLAKRFHTKDQCHTVTV